jgi:hypothetical protein
MSQFEPGNDFPGMIRFLNTCRNPEKTSAPAIHRSIATRATNQFRFADQVFIGILRRVEVAGSWTLGWLRI